MHLHKIWVIAQNLSNWNLLPVTIQDILWPNISFLCHGFRLAHKLNLARDAPSYSKAFQPQLAVLPEFYSFCSAGSTSSPHSLLAAGNTVDDSLKNLAAQFTQLQQLGTWCWATVKITEELACLQAISCSFSAWKVTEGMLYGFLNANNIRCFQTIC